MNKEPSNFWYLLPVIAGGFAVVVLGALTPIVSIIYGVPCAVIAAGSGYLVFRIMKGKPNARKWSQIAGTWIFAIVIWVAPNVYNVWETKDPCKHNDKRLVTIQEKIREGTWQLPSDFFVEGRRENPIRLVASRDFIAQLGMGERTSGKISPALRLLKEVQNYDYCLRKQGGRNIDLIEAQTNDLVAVASGEWRLVDCRKLVEARVLVKSMIDQGFWISLESRDERSPMTLSVSEKFRQPDGTPRYETLQNYRWYYNAAALVAVCTGYEGGLEINEPWVDHRQWHYPKAIDSSYINDPIELPKSTPNW